MGTGLRRFICWIQAASGCLAFAVLLISGPLLVPKISAQLGSVLSSTRGAARMAEMSEELLTREQRVLAAGLQTIDAISASIAGMKEPMGQVTQNAAYWGERMAPMAQAAAGLSSVLDSATGRLPINVPTGIEVKSKKISLPLGSVEVPVGISVTHTPFFAGEKSGLTAAARDLSEASSRMSETSRLLESGGDGLSDDAQKSLEAAQKSLDLARTEMAHLNESVLPGFLEEVKAQKSGLADAATGASALRIAIWPGFLALLLFSLLWAANGLVLLSAFRKGERG